MKNRVIKKHDIRGNIISTRCCRPKTLLPTAVAESMEFLIDRIAAQTFYCEPKERMWSLCVHALPIIMQVISDLAKDGDPGDRTVYNCSLREMKSWCEGDQAWVNERRKRDRKEADEMAALEESLAEIRNNGTAISSRPAEVPENNHSQPSGRHHTTCASGPAAKARRKKAWRLHEHGYHKLLVDTDLTTLKTCVDEGCVAANGQARKYLVTPPSDLHDVLEQPEGVIHAIGGAPRGGHPWTGVESSIGIAWHQENKQKIVVVVSRRGYGRPNSFIGPNRQRQVTPKELVETCRKKYGLRTE